MKTALRLNRQPRHQLAKLGLLGKKGGRLQRREQRQLVNPFLNLMSGYQYP